MAVFENSYSKFISWAKIILPLIALAILSSLFLFSRGLDRTQSIPYADVDIEELARDPRLSSPHFSGVSSDGAALSIFADSVTPPQGGDRLFRAETLRATINTPTGLQVDIESAQGEFSERPQQSTLTGGVIVQTSTGYQIKTNTLLTNLDGNLIETADSVVAQGPLGELDAGQAILAPSTVDDGYLLVFKRGVKLIYTPQN